MKWRGRRGSQNIEDRRDKSARGGRRSGLSGFALLIVLGLGLYLGVDVSSFIGGNGTGGAIATGNQEITDADISAGEFVSVTLADTEEIWDEIFRSQARQNYTPTKLVLFKGGTASPCGGANGATGPFYCPLDQKVYLDTDFFTTLERRLGAKGDFAAAYVVAHEVAHHVQNELGILEKSTDLRRQVSKEVSNAISVRVELQADCYSGIWARYAEARFGSIEPGDIAEAMNAAKQIGDDTLQRNAGQRPMPHTFTHGSGRRQKRAPRNSGVFIRFYRNIFVHIFVLCY